MKKVTSQQIERLYEFTRQHYVEYYDVQTELVDHLANAIEAHWQTHPETDFEEVLQKEFRKFGVFGFMEVVEQKMGQMSQRYNRILWQKTKEFFTFPKVMLTLFITLIVYLLLSFFQEKEVVIAVLNGVLFVTTVFLLWKNRKIYNQKTDKKLLFEDIILRLNNYSMFILFFFQLNIQFIKYVPSGWIFPSVYSIIFALFVIFTYLSAIYIPKNSEKYLSEIYPEYKIKTI